MSQPSSQPDPSPPARLPSPPSLPSKAALNVELIIAQLDSLPTLPRIAARLLRLTRSNEASTREAIELIKQDQAVTARILSMARRAGSGIRSGLHSATTIDKCVLLLGLEAVRNAALSVKIYEIFPPSPAPGAAGSGDDVSRAVPGPGSPAAADPFDLAEFWKHSLAVALASERLALILPGRGPGTENADAETRGHEYTGSKEIPASPRPRVSASSSMRWPAADELFVAGLLHDIGKAALHHCLPKSYAKVIEAAEASHAPLVALERRLIGIDHTVVGKRLGQKWNLPQGIIDAIWLHHSPPAAMPESIARRGFAQVVHLADVLVRELHLGYSGNYNRLADADSVAAALGIDPARLDGVRRWLPEELASRAALIGIDQLDTVDLYHEALKGANEELARLNARLLDRAASLSAKEQYLNLLGELGRRIRPGSRAMEVAEVIGQLLLPVIGAARLAVFSEPPAESSSPSADPPIEGVVIDAEKSRIERFLLSPAEGQVEGLAATRRLPGGCFESNQSEDAGFAIYPLQGRLGWVHSQLARPLPLDNCHLLPLLAQGQWVGGVIFPGCPTSGDDDHEGGGECGFMRDWPGSRAELLAVATAAGLALRTAQLAAVAERTAEELAASAETCARLQDQFVQQKAMASVGLMAAGAGHELNNPLMVISGRSELLAAEESDPKRREALEQIRQNAQRASGIISEMMDFAQPPAARPERIDLPAFVRRLAEPFTQGGIQVELGLDDEPDPPAAWADPAQLGEVIQEILDNSQQAMAAQDSNRRITLRLARAAIAPLEGHAPSWPAGGAEGSEGSLELTVTDTGAGMAPFVLEHATDPFFSARPAGRGRGLGLARRRLIEHNGGSLRLESAPGVGTTVRISVPAAR